MPDEAFLLGMPGRLRDGADDGQGRHGLRVQPRPPEPPGDDRPLRPAHRRLPGLHGRHLHHRDPHQRGRRRRAATCSPARTPRTLAIIGAGVQGEHHLRTFPLVRAFDEIRVSSLYREDAERVAALHPNARAVDTHETAVRGADVVALATHAAQPVIEPRVDRPRHPRQLRRLPPARRRAPARAAPPRAPVRRDLRGLRADAGRLRGARRTDPETATEIGAVLLGRAARPHQPRRDHRLQGDGPRRRGHRRGRTRRTRRPAGRTPAPRSRSNFAARFCSLAMNLSSPARAVPPTLRRRNGVQPSSSPLVPIACRDHFQKLKRSTWSTISPSAIGTSPARR